MKATDRPKVMKWKNLFDYRCPADGRFLNENTFKSRHYCIVCSFSISCKKFNQIVNDGYKPKRGENFDENLSNLNNLDRKPVSKDFSDI